MRRVVMGHEGDTSVVLADDKIEPTTVALLPGFAIHRVWEIDEEGPRLPVTEPSGPVEGNFFPGPNGVRFGTITVPPNTSYIPSPDVDLAEAAAEAEAKLPGMGATFDPERPGMHTTQTVDYLVVIRGKVRMETDRGVSVHLDTGDCLIQNGTAHAWFNDGDEPAVIAFALCGAR